MCKAYKYAGNSKDRLKHGDQVQLDDAVETLARLRAEADENESLNFTVRFEDTEEERERSAVTKALMPGQLRAMAALEDEE